MKGYGFLSFARNIGKNIGKNIRKKLSSKYSQKRYDHAKQSATDALKKQQKQLVIWLEIKLLIKLQESQKLHRRIIQKQMKKK